MYYRVLMQMLVGLESPNDCESRVFIAIVDLTLTNKLKEK